MIQIRYGCVIFLAAIFVVTLESGCSSKGKPLSISPSSVALAPGQTVQFQFSDSREKVYVVRRRRRRRKCYRGDD